MKQRVIVKDIDTHENWQPYLSLTQKANLHDCWSEPIISSNNEILGTFAIYHQEAKTPNNFELKLIHSYAHLASVAIEKRFKDDFIKQKEQAIIEREEELSKIFDNALVGLMYITAERILIKGNQHLAKVLGYDSSQEMIGLSMRQLHLSEERFVEFGKQNFEPLRENKEAVNIEYQLRKKDGSATWCLLSAKTIDDATPADMSKGILWIIQDINKRKALEKQVEKHTKEIETLALTDYLTGLYNRSKIDSVLEYKINYAQRYNNSFGVIMLDIDFFKNVNDTYGHQVGDQVLQTFATILKENARNTDNVGRWGGEEFLIIIPNISEENLLHLANKLRQTIGAYRFPIAGHKTASLGVTLYKQGDLVDTIIERADKALYNAKNSGRNCVKIEK